MKKRKTQEEFEKELSLVLPDVKVLGKYIADFYSAEAQLIIELDGSQHYEADEIQKDADRTAFLEGYGLTVIRIPNNEVNRNFRGVCEYIDATVKQSLSQLR